MNIYKNGASYWARFRDHRSKERRLRMAKSRTTAQALARHLADLIQARAAGLTPSRELMDRVLRMEDRLVKRLLDWGIVDRKLTYATDDLMGMVDRWAEDLRNRGRDAKYTGTLSRHVNAIIEGCGYRSWSDIEVESIYALLQQWREAGKVPGSHRSTPVAERTLSHYLADFKQFCRWAYVNGYASSHPLEGLRVEIRPTPEGQQRSNAAQRRPLTDLEQRALITETSQLAYRFRQTGHERSLLYLIALRTGLRQGAIRRIRVRDVLLDKRVVLARGSGAHNKSSRPKVLTDSVTERLATFIEGRGEDEPLFDLPAETNMARMLREDCADLRQRWISEALDDQTKYEREQSNYFDLRGIDFHCLRHTFGTTLARQGVHPRTLMSLMDHQVIDMTMRLYTHSFREDERKAIADLE